MDGLEVSIYLGVAVVFILVIALSIRASKKRQAALEAVAQQSGWQFAPDEVAPEALNAGQFPLFDIGRSKKAGNVMRASSSPVTFAVFDYRYTTGGGRNSNTTSQTVLFVQSPRLTPPLFVLSPENIFHKIGGMFGYHDIDFDGSPEFSSRYLLRAKENENQVRELFSPSVRMWLEQREKLTIEGSADGVLVYRRGRKVKPEEIRTFVEEALATARLFER